MVAIRTLTVVLTYAIGLCGALPLFPWLTPFPRLILAAGLIIGLWQDRRGSWELKPWMQNIAIVPVFLYYALQFSRYNPIEPVTSVCWQLCWPSGWAEKKRFATVCRYTLFPCSAWPLPRSLI